jgi:hypothetical protein
MRRVRLSIKLFEFVAILLVNVTDPVQVSYSPSLPFNHFFQHFSHFKMLFKTIVASLFAATVIAAPYPTEDAVEMVEAEEQLPSLEGLGGLGGLKLPVFQPSTSLQGRQANN